MRVIRLIGLHPSMHSIQFCGSPNQCWLYTCHTCIIAILRLGLPALLIAAKKICFYNLGRFYWHVPLHRRVHSLTMQTVILIVCLHEYFSSLWLWEQSRYNTMWMSSLRVCQTILDFWEFFLTSTFLVHNWAARIVIGAFSTLFPSYLSYPLRDPGWVWSRVSQITNKWLGGGADKCEICSEKRKLAVVESGLKGLNVW